MPPGFGYTHCANTKQSYDCATDCIRESVGFHAVTSVVETFQEVVHFEESTFCVLGQQIDIRREVELELLICPVSVKY